MTGGSLTTTADCISRADVIRATGDGLAASGDEWAVVNYFYAAYHTVRAALLADPIFTSIAACSAKHPNLQMSDQTATMHKARVVPGKPRAFGVNDLVSLLYPSIAFEYLELHSWSVNVRYVQGLEDGASVAKAAEYYERIRAAFDSGALVAST